MKQSTTEDLSVTYLADPEVIRLVELHQHHREAARSCAEAGLHSLAAGHTALAIEALRKARALAMGGEQ